MADLSQIAKIWNIIVESNVFNFVIFITLFSLIFKKIKLRALIDSLQTKIIEMIDAIKRVHEESKNDLLNAEKAVENLQVELDVIVEEAQKSAEVISKKILTEAEKQLENINANAKKVIEAEEKLLISNLAKSTSHSSIESAESNIKNVLSETPTLHEKYINESIEQLDRLNF